MPRALIGSPLEIGDAAFKVLPDNIIIPTITCDWGSRDMMHLAVNILCVWGLSFSCYQSWADTARYHLPAGREYLRTGPINDAATHWAEVVLDNADAIGLGITCYFADSMGKGETRGGEINREVQIRQQEHAGDYVIESFAPTSIMAHVGFKGLKHCTLLLHHLSGYVQWGTERITFHNRFIHLAESSSTISWRPGESGKDISAVVAALFRRYKLVGSIYYKPHLYLTMEERDL
jgi:hypothetical protein